MNSNATYTFLKLLQLFLNPIGLSRMIAFFQDLTALHYACASNNISSYSVLHSNNNTTAKLDPLLLQLSSLNGALDMAKRLLDDYPNALLAQSDKIHIIDKTQLDKTKNTRPDHKQGKNLCL